MDTLLKWTYRVPDLVTLGHDQCRATVVLHAAKPAGIKIGPMQMIFGQIAVLADLHRDEKRTRLEGNSIVAPLSRFFGFRRCHPALFAVVGA
jgi:hypothetical protein